MLATTILIQCFLGYRDQNLPRIALNYCALFITTNGLCLIKAMFKFKKFWIFYYRGLDDANLW